MATLVRQVVPTVAVPLLPGASTRLVSSPRGQGDGKQYDQASVFLDVHLLESGVQVEMWLRGGASAERQIRLFGVPSVIATTDGLRRATWPQPLTPYVSVEITLHNSSTSISTTVLRALQCSRLEEI